mmetsp:Transcript_61423/g.163444  ORF Transcript_61423/g.163444 Transcript_61423/m.163444 type:complete len:88 (-) Transcript_61423:952-1215(-)
MLSPSRMALRSLGVASFKADFEALVAVHGRTLEATLPQCQSRVILIWRLRQDATVECERFRQRLTEKKQKCETRCVRLHQPEDVELA